MITFTTTAAIRPTILDQTYNSFNQNLLGVSMKECNLVINVDPVPSNNIGCKQKILDVAYKYFKNVHYRTPDTPNFPNALSWVWSNTSDKYVFHLEDDWLLLEPVDINNLITTIENNIIGVSLNWNILKDNKYRIRLSPCLINGEWAKLAAKSFSYDSCPEINLRKYWQPSGVPENEWKALMVNYPGYSDYKTAKRIVKDTGISWRKKRKLVKDRKNGFTTWKKK